VSDVPMTIVDLYDDLVQKVTAEMSRLEGEVPFVIFFVKRGRIVLTPNELIRGIPREHLPPLIRHVSAAGGYDHVIIVSEVFARVEDGDPKPGVAILVDGDLARNTVILRGEDGKPSGEVLRVDGRNTGFFSDLVQVSEGN
jgi:hypothetical protein